MQVDTVHFSAKGNDSISTSFINSDMNEGSQFSTTWGPVGFSRLHHPLNLMVCPA